MPICPKCHKPIFPGTVGAKAQRASPASAAAQRFASSAASIINPSKGQTPPPLTPWDVKAPEMGGQTYAQVWVGVLTWVWEGTKPGQPVPNIKSDLRAKWASPKEAAVLLAHKQCAHGDPQPPDGGWYKVPSVEELERLAASPNLEIAKRALQCLYGLVDVPAGAGYELASYSTDGNKY